MKRIAFGPLVSSDRYKERDGSGNNNATSELTAMIADNSIHSMPGMFPECDEEIERLVKRRFSPDTRSLKKPFVTPEDIPCDSLDPLQILLEKEEVIIEVNEREAAINAGRGNGKTRPFRKGLPLHLRRMKNGGSALTGFTFAGVS